MLDLLEENAAIQKQFTDHCKETTATILRKKEVKIKKKEEGLVVDRNCGDSLRSLILE